MNTSELETLIRTILSEQLTTPAQTPAQPQGKGIFQSVSEAIDAAHQAFLRYQQCPLKTPQRHYQRNTSGADAAAGEPGGRERQ